MEPVRPDFVPDPSLSRTEMEALQRSVAADAEFADRLPFDPATVSQTTGPADTTGSAQSTLTGERPRMTAHEPPVVAGIDQSFINDTAISAIVALQDGEVIERTHAVTELSVPYIPGLLSFREGEAIVEAFATLDCEPDLACFDGSGRIHFRQAGLATHMGVVFDLPAIGIAKNLLCGDPRESVDDRAEGWRTPIESTDAVDCPSGTTIGYAYQSRQYDSGNRYINPLYVSPGHRVSAETAVDLVAALGGGYKLPEPTRLADSYADEVKSSVVDD
ncbi:MAG: endonuclease V [Euryarchaeota archaeon]|nr:endonuclease V [Euryarchaeota archaeon]